MQHHDYLVVENPASILENSTLQLQRLLLQLVSGEVIFKDSPLFHTHLHILYHVVCKFKVTVKYLYLVHRLVEVQIPAQKKEMHILAVLLPVQFGHLFLYLRQFDPAVDRPSCIYDLAGLQSKIVPERRDVDSCPAAEIPVPKPPVTKKTCGQ